jgi:TolB protein
MVGSRKGGKNLYIVDADGGGLLQLTRDNAPCMAPTWAPNGQRIVYTSFHAGFPDVYEINLATSLRTRLASFPGINSGANISPDGKEMVLVLSKDGNPDLYTITSGSKQAVRLTRTPDAAEASPSWSPDGRRIVYVSDRSGSPQLYVTDRSGQKLTRLTFRGDQNVAPDWGPNGLIAYSSRLGGRFQICVLDPAKGTPTQLTDGGYDCEDPTWAPDGRHIAYARSSGFHSEVYILDISGDPQVRLLQLEGDWYAPSWSPNSKGKR